jgi:kexin
MHKVLSLSLVISALFITSGCNNPFNKKSNDDTKESNQRVKEKSSNVVIKEFKIKEGEEDIVLTPFQNAIYLKKLDGLDSKEFKILGKNIVLNFKPNYAHPLDTNKDNTYEVKLYVVDKSNSDYIVLLKVKVLKGKGSIVQGGGANLAIDLDEDYIPDNIEKMLGKSSENSDENDNGILDGLEGDPLFDKQWYIKADGTPTNPSGVSSVVGNDLNLFDVYRKYMGYNGGNPIIIQIVDSGIDVNHEDLKDNIDLMRSLDNSRQGEPIPGGFFKPHGTMLAGIAAARAFNNVGIRGVAPFAKIAGSNWLVDQSLDGLEAAWLGGYGANEIAVSNNSWGRYYTIDTFYEDILAKGVKNLRGGKGRVYVFASGNSRAYNADANTQYILNNRFPIVVGALTVENKVAEYSTPGANLWITAYGGSASFDTGPTIATTYITGESQNTWSEDINKNYTYAMAGSSAAAPMVSGCIALMLEACPKLSWRDVKYILAKSAKKVDSSSSNWITNSAGFNFNRDYGFGLIDTKKAIDICKNGYKNLGKEIKVSVATSMGDIPINGTKELSIGVETNVKIEWVEAIVDLDTNNASDYDIYLKSPSGTEVLLIKSGTKIGASFIPDTNWMKGGFRFSTGAFLDEDSIGEWRLKIVDTKSNSATLKSIELKIYGH